MKFLSVKEIEESEDTATVETANELDISNKNKA